MDFYHFAKLAVEFGSIGFALGSFLVHYSHTQRRSKKNEDRIATLESAVGVEPDKWEQDSDDDGE